MDLFKIYDPYDKKLRCSHIKDKYGIHDHMLQTHLFVAVLQF